MLKFSKITIEKMEELESAYGVKTTLDTTSFMISKHGEFAVTLYKDGNMVTSGQVPVRLVISIGDFIKSML